MLERIEDVAVRGVAFRGEDPFPIGLDHFGKGRALSVIHGRGHAPGDFGLTQDGPTIGERLALERLVLAPAAVLDLDSPRSVCCPSQRCHESPSLLPSATFRSDRLSLSRSIRNSVRSAWESVADLKPATVVKSGFSRGKIGDFDLMLCCPSLGWRLDRGAPRRLDV